MDILGKYTEKRCNLVGIHFTNCASADSTKTNERT